MGSWASYHIEKLQKGETVSFRPKGNSMQGKIESGQLCTVSPVELSSLVVGDIVLCKVNGTHYLHLISAVADGKYQISNNKNHVNGWTKTIYGKLMKVED
jgi:hypothetical protein